MRKSKGIVVAAALAVASLCAAPNASAEVRLTIQNGRVSLVAKDATVRQILAEWARLGQTKIVNLERIPGGPLTLELDDVTEEHALDVLLRSVSGYIAAPRPAQTANLSRFDRIFVMPTAAPPRAAAVAAAPSPTFPQQPPMPTDDDTDDDRPAPPVPVPNPRGPVFNTFPQPTPGGAMPPGFANPQQQPVPQQPTPQVPGANPATPGGVAVPGMMVPAPQQPGMPGQPQPGQPGQPRRPGGDPDGL